MKAFLRFATLVPLIIWLGGIIFFSFVVAPAVFTVLMPLRGGQHLAGDIVNRSLNALHCIGLACGAIFLLTSTALLRRFRSLRHYLVIFMLSLTAASLFWVTPRMVKLREFNPDLQSASAAVRAEFDYLHSISVGLEGSVLLLGLGVVWLTAKEDDRR